MRTQTREWCAPITDTDYFIHSIWTLKSVSSEFAIFIALDQTVHMHMKFMKLLQYYSNKSDSWDSWRRCRVISGNFRDVLLNSVGLSKFLFWGRGRCSKCIYDSIFDCEIRSNWFTSFKLSRCRIFMKLIVGSAWRKPTGISATARSNKKCLCFILRWFSIVTVTFFFSFFSTFSPSPAIARVYFIGDRKRWQLRTGHYLNLERLFFLEVLMDFCYLSPLIFDQWGFNVLIHRSEFSKLFVILSTLDCGLLNLCWRYQRLLEIFALLLYLDYLGLTRGFLTVIGISFEFKLLRIIEHIVWFFISRIYIRFRNELFLTLSQFNKYCLYLLSKVYKKKIRQSFNSWWCNCD